ncbi:MAG: T9SS type A sorting domain-containing protein, partial [Bacteroidota bacterium]
LVSYNTPGIYSVTLVATNANGTNTITQQNYITITTSNQAAPVANNVQRCGPGPVTMTATGSGLGVLRWWDAPGGGNQLSTGSSYTTTLSGPSTTLWVDEEFGSGVVDYTGEATNGFGTGAFFTANDIRGLYFDVTSPVVLNTVDVYSNSAGDRTIEVLDEQGNTVVEKVVSIPASPNTPYTVTLNFTLYPGNNYFIKCRGLVDLYRNSTGALYPLNSSFVNITGSNAGSPGYYYFFYNWIYTDITCNTSRTQVIGTDTCFVGLNDLFAEGSLNVFPNPTQGKFEVNFDAGGSRDFIIRISETTGKMVLNETYEAFSGEFRKSYDMSKIAKGVYVLEIISNDRSFSKKLVLH